MSCLFLNLITTTHLALELLLWLLLLLVWQRVVPEGLSGQGEGAGVRWGLR